MPGAPRCGIGGVCGPTKSRAFADRRMSRAAVEIVVEIELLADLRLDWNASIERPDIVLALDLLGFLAIDIDPP
jgi:hypothetical protein